MAPPLYRDALASLDDHRPSLLAELAAIDQD
jgi:hypothetical protein